MIYFILVSITLLACLYFYLNSIYRRSVSDNRYREERHTAITSLADAVTNREPHENITIGQTAMSFRLRLERIRKMKSYSFDGFASGRLRLLLLFVSIQFAESVYWFIFHSPIPKALSWDGMFHSWSWIIPIVYVILESYGRITDHDPLKIFFTGKRKKQVD